MQITIAPPPNVPSPATVVVKSPEPVNEPRKLELANEAPTLFPTKALKLNAPAVGTAVCAKELIEIVENKHAVIKSFFILGSFLSEGKICTEPRHLAVYLTN